MLGFPLGVRPLGVLYVLDAPTALIESRSPSVIATVELTVDGVVHRYASTDQVYDGEVYTARLLQWPQLEEVARDQWGLREAANISIELSNADGALNVLDERSLPGISLFIQLILTHYWSDGSVSDEIVSRTLVCTGVRRSSSKWLLTLTDQGARVLDQLYPAHVWSADDWPQLLSDHVGQVVPYPLGTAIKTPCALVEDNDGAGPWIYAAGALPTATVLTVYRDGWVVDSAEYTLGSATAVSGSYSVRTIAFAKQQRDTEGRLLPIEVDLQGGDSRNVVREIQRLLQFAGVAVDSYSFDTAADYADEIQAWIDVSYGRDGRQRTLLAIIEELLLVARANLCQTGSGTWAMTQDRPTDLHAVLNEAAGDPIQFDELGAGEIPASVELRYRPTHIDPSQLSPAITRTIPGGTSPTPVRYEAPAVRSHQTADRLVDYLAKRLAYGASGSALAVGRYYQQGDLLAIAGTTVYSGSRNWLVTSASRQDHRTDLQLLQYDAAVYNYTAGTLPADANDTYTPDYSHTPPAAPTGLTVTGSGTHIAQDGRVTAWVQLKATPPAVNWSAVRFKAQGVSIPDVYQMEGEDAGDGTWVGTLSGMLPGVQYDFLANVVNAFGVVGTSTAALRQSTPTDTTVPVAPSSATAAQGTGRVVTVAWGRVGDADLSGYIVQRQVNGGTWTEVARVAGTSYTDTAVNYATNYGYRIYAYDRSGNVGPYSPVASVTPAANVGDGDVSGSNPIQGTKLANINADTITAGTLTGRTVRTAASGKRFEVSQSRGEAFFIDENNNEIATIGLRPDGEDMVIGYFGSITHQAIASKHENNSPLSTMIVVNHSGSGFARGMSASSSGCGVAGYTNSVSSVFGAGVIGVAASGGVGMRCVGRFVMASEGFSYPYLENSSSHLLFKLSGTVWIRFNLSGSIERTTNGGSSWTTLA